MIWLPDIYIYHLEEMTEYRLFVQSAALKVNRLQQFRYTKEITTRVTCRMDLRRFPHDNQTCLFELGSFGYDDRFLTIKLKDNFKVGKIPHPSGYTIEIVNTRETAVWSVGRFTTVGFNLKLQRHLSFYLFNYYGPTGLFVIVSWASFSMPSDKLQFR